MRIYNYKNKWEQFLTPDIVSMLTQIHEYKGKQNLFIESSADALNGLVEIAKIQSTEASNKIEGIYTSDERIKKLALAKTNPKNRAEEEIAGYRDVLNTIHSLYPHPDSSHARADEQDAPRPPRCGLLPCLRS